MLAILSKSVLAWIDHRGGSKGAALAFYALFAMMPILVLAIAGATRLFGPDHAQVDVVSQVAVLMGSNGAKAIQALLVGARVPETGPFTTALASILSLVGATAVFVELKASLDELWGVEAPKGLPVIDFLRTHLRSFGLVLVLAFLLLASLVFSATLALVEREAGELAGLFPTAMAFVSGAASPVILACLFAVIYKGLPETTLSWRDVWIGATFTTILFGIGKYAIGVYLGSSTVAASFGAAGSLIAVLLWVYYSAQIFLLGAEFTRQYALASGSLRAQSRRGSEPAPVSAHRSRRGISAPRARR